LGGGMGGGIIVANQSRRLQPSSPFSHRKSLKN